MATRPNWTAIPAARSSAPILKLKLYAVVGSLLFAAVCGIIALFVALGSNTAPDVDPTTAQPRAGSLAETAARDFLAGRATRVPTASGVDASFGRDVADSEFVPVRLEVLSFARARWELVTLGAQTAEVHTFDVTVSEVDQPLVVTVVALVGDRGAVLAAQPSIGPRIWERFDVAGFDYRGVEGASTAALPEPVGAAIARWAQAYGANDGAELQAVVDDPAGTVDSYVGIGGLDAAPGDITVVSHLPLDGGLLVRVRVLFSATSANGFSASNDFDLLITQAATTTPKVVAWGPPGSGPTLTPYQNRATSAPTTTPETQP